MLNDVQPPVICLVTDRRRLSTPTDGSLLRLVSAAAAAGVDLVHVRERDRDDRTLADLTRRIVACVSGSGTRVVVNDRADIAIAAAASGVHLRSDSAPGDRVRAICPRRFVIGRSVHSAAEARAAATAGVDYVIMGTVYRTPSKSPTASLAGVHGLAEVCRSVPVPVLAIGGVTIDNLREVAGAGASGVAAIGLFAETFNAHSDRDPEGALISLVAAIRAAFGSDRGAAAR